MHTSPYARSLYVCIMCEAAYVSNSRAAFHEWGWLMRRLKVYYTDWRLLLLSFFAPRPASQSACAQKAPMCASGVSPEFECGQRLETRALLLIFSTPQMVFYAECKNVCSRVRDNCAAVRLLIYTLGAQCKHFVPFRLLQKRLFRLYCTRTVLLCFYFFLLCRERPLWKGTVFILSRHFCCCWALILFSCRAVESLLFYLLDRSKSARLY